MVRNLRLLLLLGALFSLLAALWGGVYRLGWAIPLGFPGLPLQHGPLMVSGFLGTVICLERAAALGSWSALLVPLLSALGALLYVGGEVEAAAWSWGGGAVGLILLYGLLLRRRRDLPLLVMAGGAASWGAGLLFWRISGEVVPALPFWVAFLTLTVAAERLELGRFHLTGRRPQRLFGLLLPLFGLAVGLSPLAPGPAFRLLGLALLGTACWLGVYDLSRRQLGQRGLRGYLAWALSCGFFWLGLGGLLWLLVGRVDFGPRYDALLHSLFVGFLFSMIMGHAPLIFPALSGRNLSYRRILYLPLLLLQLSLLVRLGADLAGWWAARGLGEEALMEPWLHWQQWGGLLNAAAILLFFPCLLSGGLASRTVSPEGR